MSVADVKCAKSHHLSVKTNTFAFRENEKVRKCENKKKDEKMDLS